VRPPGADVFEGHPRRWAILPVLCGVLIVIAVDNTILSIALPSIREQIHASESDLQWITAAYGLVLAGVLLPAAVVGDRIGRRRMLIAGLVIFGSASAAAALVDSPDALIACRAALGLGGAAAMPATLAIIGNVFAPSERGRAISIWSGVAGLGAAAGPLVGGLLLAHFWWGSVFLVNVPICVAGVVAAALIVPESFDPSSPRVDVAGAALWTAALVGLIFGIIEAPERGWTSGTVLTVVPAAAVLLAVFAARTRRAAFPLLAPATARHPGMRAGAAVIPTTFFAIFGTQFVLTQWLQGPEGLGTVAAAACFAPGAVGSVVGSLLNHAVVARGGHVRAIGWGAAGMVASLVLTGVGVGTGSLTLAVLAFSLFGFAQGMVIPSGVELIMTSAAPEQAGSAAGVNETIVEAGGALGIAVMGSVLVGAASFGWPIVVGAGVVAVGAAGSCAVLRRRPAPAPAAVS
jgi:MFS transporter, DHA2 family, multidrug resistance protein